MALGEQVQLRFVITQHIRDASLMLRLQEFFGCGTISRDGDTKQQLRIRGVNDLETKVFPVLDQYSLQTQKALNAQVFRQVHAIINNKLHLSKEGLAEIKILKSTINRGRINS